MATSWSGFWGGAGYANLYNRSHIAMKMRRLMRGRSNLDERAQLVALIAASTATTGAQNRKQLKADTAPVAVGGAGGVRQIETITSTSAQANATGGTAKVAASARAWPTTYPANGSQMNNNRTYGAGVTYAA